jgi:hypothetical protein
LEDLWLGKCPDTGGSEGDWKCWLLVFDGTSAFAHQARMPVMSCSIVADRARACSFAGAYVRLGGGGSISARLCVEYVEYIMSLLADIAHSYIPRLFTQQQRLFFKNVTSDDGLQQRPEKTRNLPQPSILRAPREALLLFATL